MNRKPTEIRTAGIGPFGAAPGVLCAGRKARCRRRQRPGGNLESRASFGGRRASVDVFAPIRSESLDALAAAPPVGAVIVHERAWTPADIVGTSLAVAECADDAEAALFAAAAREAGVPVNVIDRPAFCDFSFGAIVNRSPLVIGISTDGAAPVFGQAIRSKIEALIPKGFARWADAARNWRPRVQALALSFRGRRTFWEKFTERAIAAPDQAPGEADLEALLKPTSRQRPAPWFLSAQVRAIRSC